MLIIEKAHYDDMLAHAAVGLPNEACGLFAGEAEGDDTVVRKVYRLSNIDQSPEHFSMDAKEQFAAFKDARGNGWRILGNFHSHPATPARPSAEDIRLAFDPGMSYIIVSMIDPAHPVLKSFHIENGAASEEAYTVSGYPGQDGHFSEVAHGAFPAVHRFVRQKLRLHRRGRYGPAQGGGAFAV